MKLPLTSTQSRALQWLADRGGIGIWYGGKVSAGGPDFREIANFNRPTWASLLDRGFIREDAQRRLCVVPIDPPLDLGISDIEEAVLATRKQAETFAHVR